MKWKRARWITLSATITCVLFFVWFLGGLHRVNIKYATHAEIVAATDPSVRYTRVELPLEKNAWQRIGFLFAGPTAHPTYQFVPPLNLRCQQEVAPFLDEYRWIEPKLDRLLAMGGAQLDGPPEYMGGGRTEDLCRIYISMALAYAEAKKQREKIWPAFRRYLLHLKLVTSLEANLGIYQFAQTWYWGNDLKVAFADPNLTVSQLEEGLRILPTEADYQHGIQRGANVSLAWVLEGYDRKEVMKLANGAGVNEELRQFCAGNLDVAKAVRSLSNLTVAFNESVLMPYSKARAFMKAAQRANLPPDPDFPFPKKNEGWFSKSLRTFSYYWHMRSTHNSLMFFMRSERWRDYVENVFEIRAKIVLARTYGAIQIYRRRFGRVPTNLQNLVDRKIIKELPRDPFNDGPLGYDGTKLWCVGSDLVDNGGSDPRNSHAPYDVVFDFTIHQWP